MDAVHTNVIKRNGEEVCFNLDKIVNAITAANKEVDRLHQLNDYQVQAIGTKKLVKRKEFEKFISESVEI